MWRILAVTFFGLGFSPIVPGTVGSLGGVALFFVIPPAWPYPVVVALLAVSGSVLSVALGRWAVQHFRSGDPPPFVLDEVVGYLVTVCAFSTKPGAGVAVGAFFLFRIFDILKPPPGRRLERAPHGWGILLDDVVAGLYAAGCLKVILWLSG